MPKDLSAGPFTDDPTPGFFPDPDAEGIVVAPKTEPEESPVKKVIMSPVRALSSVTGKVLGYA